MTEQASLYEHPLPRRECPTNQYALHTNPLDHISANHYSQLREKHTLQDFMLTSAEKKEIRELKVHGLFYSLLR